MIKIKLYLEAGIRISLGGNNLANIFIDYINAL